MEEHPTHTHTHTSDIVFDSETQNQTAHIISLGQVQKIPKSTNSSSSPGNLILLKTLKEGSPSDKLQRRRKGLQQVPAFLV